MVRHAQHEGAADTLIGRAGVQLSAAGRRTAERLADVLACRGVTAVQSSPQPRAVQTAEPLARLAGVPIAIAPEFDEVDFGPWTGCSFNELRRQESWNRWNSERGTYRPAGAESMGDLERRVLHGLSHLLVSHAGQSVAVFTHAEPIRAALLHFSNMKHSDFARVRIDIASLTTLEFEASAVTIAAQNECPAAPMVSA